MSNSSTSIHTDGNDVAISTEWLNKDSENKTRLLKIKTGDHEFTFFMDENCNILFKIDRGRLESFSRTGSAQAGPVSFSKH